jgi:hypothetical protein
MEAYLPYLDTDSFSLSSFVAGFLAGHRNVTSEDKMRPRRVFQLELGV